MKVNAIKERLERYNGIEEYQTILFTNEKEKEKDPIQLINLFYFLSKQNQRDYNEDKAIMIQKMLKDQAFIVMAVFDGHGGDQVSTYARNLFFEKLNELTYEQMEEFYQDSIITKEQKKLFREQIDSDKSILNDNNRYSYENGKIHKYIQNIINIIQNNVKNQKQLFNDAGSTLNMIIVYRDKVYSFNMGDSRTIALNKDFIPQQLTTDHKTYCSYEQYILEQQGLKIKDDRVNGVLAMTKALGDVSLKLLRDVDYRVYNKDDFLFITCASDGLYDHMDQDEFCSKFVTHLKEISDKIKLEEKDGVESVIHYDNPLQYLYKYSGVQWSDNLTIITLIL